MLKVVMFGWRMASTCQEPKPTKYGRIDVKTTVHRFKLLVKYS